MLYCFDIIIKYYNHFFGVILGVLILLCIILFQQKCDDKRYYLKYVTKRKLTEMIVCIVGCFCLAFFLDEIFSINVWKVFRLSKYWRVLLSIWMVANFVSGKELYNGLRFYKYLQKIKDDGFFSLNA